MDCVHHWVLETPNGPLAKGRCKRCRRVSEFPNSTPEDLTHWRKSKDKAKIVNAPGFLIGRKQYGKG
jgi:hypothetical protein